jgi:hypothetical protein
MISKTMPIKQLSAWNAVVAQVRKDNPGISLKDAMIKAKSLYKGKK